MKRPIRILALDQGKGVWGAQRYLLRLRPLLDARGIEVTLASPATLQFRHTWMSQGFPAIDLDLPTSRSIRTDGRVRLTGVVREGGRSIRSPLSIAAAVRDGDFDGILANSHWTHLDAALAAAMARRPAILHLHEPAIPGFGARLRDMAILGSSTAVAVSHAVAETTGRAARARTLVVRNGVDLDVNRPATADEREHLRELLGAGADDVLVLAATRIDPSKRIEDILELSRKLPADCRIVIAGTTSEFPEYEARMRATAATDRYGRVEFLGFRADVPDLLRACDIYLHTGLIEGMPLGIVEAQATGVPVVAYDAPGVREAIDDGSTGFVVPASDVEALRLSVTTMAADRELRSRFARSARAFAEQRHSLTDQADRNAEIIASCCARRTTA